MWSFGRSWRGGRGLLRGNSLARLLAEHRGKRNEQALPPFTEAQILRWADAYREHLAHANPLVDQPTRRILRQALADIDDAVSWGRRALDAVLSVDAGLPRAADEWAALVRPPEAAVMVGVPAFGSLYLKLAVLEPLAIVTLEIVVVSAVSRKTYVPVESLLRLTVMVASEVLGLL